MQAIDLAIVGLYILATIAIGLIARRRAARSLQSYYLADKSMPWYLLGLSNASDMYDVTGTMWLVTLCVVYGLKSIWIPWVWPARKSGASASPQKLRKPPTRQLIPAGISRAERHTPVRLLCVLKVRRIGRDQR